MSGGDGLRRDRIAPERALSEAENAEGRPWRAAFGAFWLRGEDLNL